MVDLPKDNIVSCKQEGCSVMTTGFCLEGIDVKECPYTFISDGLGIIDINEGNDDSLTDLTTQGNDIDLFSGDELSEDEISTITIPYPVNLILVMGEPNSGKTTLLAALYDQFQKGEFSGYLFAGSKTQIGYEKRCHHARLLSGNTTPDTERTSSSDFHYLHLAVRKEELDKPIIHLLFTDISGEQFRLIRDQEEEMMKLTALKKADHIFCVADGDLFLNKDTRHSAKQNLIKLIGRAYQTNMVGVNKGVNIIVTKWDKLSGEDSTCDIESFLINPLKAKFPSLIKNVLKVASRSMTSAIKSGTGLDSFLGLCTQRNHYIDSKDVIPVKEPLREFQRFKYYR